MRLAGAGRVASIEGSRQPESTKHTWEDQSLRKLVTIATALVIALTAFTLSWAPSQAISPSEQQCLDQGGFFERVQGQVICTVTEEGKNPKFTSEEETTGQGNIGNKTETNTNCEGTGS